MKWIWAIIFVVLGVGLVYMYMTRTSQQMGLPTVASVNVEKYMGEWYEIARLPNMFEKNSVYGNVKAEYKLNAKKSYVEVYNSYQDQNGEIKSAHGIAFITDPETNSKLKVSFVPVLKYWGIASAPYYIIELDEKNYRYAMVGTPDRKYLWILSRTKSLPTLTYNALVKRAQDLGFETQRLFVNPVDKK